MSRIRSIHPGIWTDVDIVGLSPFARLFYIGIWNECDDKGIFLWSALHLKMRVLPADNVDAAALLGEIEVAGRIQRFTVAGKDYGAVKNFAKFQRPKKPNDIHPATPEILEFAGHPPVSPPAGKPKVPDQFPTGGEKSPQMEDGGGRRESSLDADASNASVPAPTQPIDIAKSIFDGGVRMLKRQRFSEKRAREIVGKWRKDAQSDGIVLSCLARAQSEAPSDLVAWMMAAIASEKGRLNDQSPTPGPSDPRGPTERASMAAFGLDPEMGGTADAGAEDRPARRDPDQRALPEARDG